MKKPVFGIFAVSILASSPSFASDASYENCMAFAEANGLDPAPYTCIAENIGDDAALLAEQSALETMAKLEVVSPELQAAINDCVPS